MDAAILYNELQNDFIKEGISDYNWSAKMPQLERFLSVDFCQSGIGLMCDFTNTINIVFTTVFLSDNVLQQILSRNISNALIFSHHPTNWDIENHGGNYATSIQLIELLKERNISVFVLHNPLDNYGEFSTCKTLAEQLSVLTDFPAFSFYGALCGVIGGINCDSTDELQYRYSKVLGHKTSLYRYGSNNINGQRVAVCPGGGNALFVLEEMLENDTRIILTGVTLINSHSEESHLFAKNNHINIFGGTHYSSKKFAPLKMCSYFEKFGLVAEFIDDHPNFFDL